MSVVSGLGYVISVLSMCCSYSEEWRTDNPTPPPPNHKNVNKPWTPVVNSQSPMITIPDNCLILIDLLISCSAIQKPLHMIIYLVNRLYLQKYYNNYNINNNSWKFIAQSSSPTKPKVILIIAKRCSFLFIRGDVSYFIFSFTLTLDYSEECLRIAKPVLTKYRHWLTCSRNRNAWNAPTPRVLQQDQSRRRTRLRGKGVDPVRCHRDCRAWVRLFPNIPELKFCFTVVVF